MLSLSRFIPSLLAVIVCLDGCSKAAPPAVTSPAATSVPSTGSTSVPTKSPTSVPTPMTADDRAEPVPFDKARLPNTAEVKTEPEPLPADDKKK